MADTIARWLQGIGTLLIGMALMVGIFTLGPTKTQPRTISITGKATKSLAPNESVITGSFEETAAKQDEARSKARDKAAAAIEAIKKQGIEEKKITTTQVSVYPEYDFTAGKQKITGYKATTTLSISLNDPAKADPIISSLTQGGAKSTAGPSLGFSQETKDQLTKELRLQAIVDAKTQADQVTKEAGTRLGKIVSISGGETPSDIPPPIMYAQGSGEKVADRSDITVGEKDLTVTVTVVYQLR